MEITTKRMTTRENTFNKSNDLLLISLTKNDSSSTFERSIHALFM